MNFNKKLTRFSLTLLYILLKLITIMTITSFSVYININEKLSILILCKLWFFYIYFLCYNLIHKVRNGFVGGVTTWLFLKKILRIGKENIEYCRINTIKSLKKKEN